MAHPKLRILVTDEDGAETDVAAGIASAGIPASIIGESVMDTDTWGYWAGLKPGHPIKVTDTVGAVHQGTVTRAASAGVERPDGKVWVKLDVEYRIEEVGFP